MDRYKRKRSLHLVSAYLPKIPTVPAYPEGVDVYHLSENKDRGNMDFGFGIAVTEERDSDPNIRRI